MAPPSREAAPTCVLGPGGAAVFRLLVRGAPCLMRSRSPLFRFRIRSKMASITFATMSTARALAFLRRSARHATAPLQVRSTHSILSKNSGFIVHDSVDTAGDGRKWASVRGNTLERVEVESNTLPVLMRKVLPLSESSRL